MRLHQRIPWWEYLQQWRTVEWFYVQVTVAQGELGLAVRSRMRISVIDELSKEVGDVMVPDCDSWDREFKGRLTRMAMSNASEREALIAELRNQVTSGFVTELYGRRRGK
ncbi:hypothetical protein HY971_01510 [Candidatus Kaiserbacteria bacterium]|nr:hypothetical protein [Candidatus Kaiserbacteria bacterium]